MTKDLRTKTGGMCRSNQIHRFFLNRFYCGMMERDGKIYEGKHKGLISINQFNKAQNILHDRHTLTRKSIFTPLKDF